VKIARAGWTSASFLVYAGALIALIASWIWLGIIAAQHSQGAFAGWSALFWGVAEAIALVLLLQRRRLAAGLAAFVGLGLWAVMVGAFFAWFGWLSDSSSAFGGWHWGDYGFELLVLLAALVDLRIWRHPLLVAVAAPFAWLFVADLISNGGNWTAVVTLLFGFALFFVGLGLDGGDSRPYGFWVHVTAGLLIGGAFLYWWHSSDAEWAGIIIVSLIFIFVGAGLRRSSYGVLGTIGLVAATGFYSVSAFISPVLSLVGADSGSSSPQNSLETWQVPVAYICLGLFLTALGMLLYGRRADEPQAA
jgi:MFS family permease